MATGCFFFFSPSWVIEALPQKTMIDDVFKGLKKHRLFLKLCHCLYKGRRRNYLNSTGCLGPQQGSSEADAEIRVHSAFAPTPHTKCLVGAGMVWSLSEAQCSQTTMLGSYECMLPPWELQSSSCFESCLTELKIRMSGGDGEISISLHLAQAAFCMVFIVHAC